MMVSTKGRYALRVMIDLAEHQTDGYIPLKEIASRQNISEKYLESIIKSLVKSNMLGWAWRGQRRRVPSHSRARPIHHRRSASFDRRFARTPVACLEATPSHAPVCLIAARFRYGEGSMKS